MKPRIHRTLAVLEFRIPETSPGMQPVEEASFLGI